MRAIQDNQKRITLTLRRLKFDETDLIIEPNQKLSIINAGKNSESGTEKKYFFMLQPTEQQTSPLGQGQTYHFQTNFTYGTTYCVECLNQPKLRCQIFVQKPHTLQVLAEKEKKEQQQFSNLPLPEVEQDVAEQQQTKEKSYLSPFKAHSDMEYGISQYDKILNSEQNFPETLENRYINYFKQQFSLWKEFFKEKKKKPAFEKAIASPQYNSDSLDSFEKKRQVTSVKDPHQEIPKFTLSSDNYSQEESFSLIEGKSVDSHLYSHQEIRDQQEELKCLKKNMKKTTSEYGGGTQEELQIQSEQLKLEGMRIHSKESPKKKKSEHLQTLRANTPNLSNLKRQNVLQEAANNWLQNVRTDRVSIPVSGDEHLVEQWLTFLENRYKVFNMYR